METRIIQCLCSLLVAFCLALSTYGAAEPTLQLIHVLYRHGDRAPIEPYPNDPYKNGSVWPEGFGQLTKLGKDMQYALGRWLRKRYDGFVNSRWLPQEVLIRSTDFDRTIMSVECNLAAFYFPDHDWRFESNLSWVPTPIHTAPADDDKLLNVDQSCPRIKVEMAKQNELPEVKAKTEQSHDLFTYLSTHSGMNVTSVIDVDFLYDTLHVELLYGLPLPTWTQGVMSRMKDLTDFSFKLSAYSQEMKRLRAGPLIGEIGNHMLEKSHSKLPQEKMYMYSAHDTTVATLLSGLHVFNGIAPPYASTVLIELHRGESGFYVQMFLRNDTLMVEPPHLLTLPGCAAQCPLDQWLTLTQAVVPTDWSSECDREEPEQLHVQGMTGWLLVGGLMLTVALVVGAGSTLCTHIQSCWKAGRKSTTNWCCNCCGDNANDDVEATPVLYPPSFSPPSHNFHSYGSFGPLMTRDLTLDPHKSNLSPNVRFVATVLPLKNKRGFLDTV